MKKYYLTIISLFFILNIYLVANYYYLQRDNLIQVNSLDRSNEKVAILEEVLWICFFDSGKKIDTPINLKNSKGLVTRIDELISDSIVFVFIPEGECGSCIINLIDDIKESLNYPANSNVAFISSFYDIYEHRKIEKELNLSIYDLAGHKLGTLFERRNLISIFKLDDEHKIKHLYLHNKPISANQNKFYKLLTSD